MDPLAALEGGDRRSIGAVPTVVEQIRAYPELFDRLVSGLTHPSAVVRMRTADALEKLTRQDAAALVPHRKELLAVAEATEQIELRWHLAVMLPRLAWPPATRRRVVAVLRKYLRDSRSSIARTLALQGLADLAAAHPSLRPSVALTLRKASVSGTPAMRARARKLLPQLSKK